MFRDSAPRRSRSRPPRSGGAASSSRPARASAADVTRDEIVVARTAVGRVLHARGVEGELYVVGGAAIALALDARRSTRDVDGVFEPKIAIYEAAAEVAADLGLPPGWLNDAVNGYLAGPDPLAAPVLEVPGLRCLAASPRMLLALKVLAHRIGEDDEDVLLLARELELHE